MTKVAFVANSCWSLWRFRFAVMKLLAASGFAVIAVAPRDEKTKELIDAGFHWVDITISRKGLNPIRDLNTFWTLIRTYKSERPDFIYHYTIKPNIYGTLAAAIMGVPSIAVVTGLGSVYLRENWLTKLVTFMYRVSLRRAHQIWFLNDSDFTEFKNRKILNPNRPNYGQLLGSEGLNIAEYRPREKNSTHPVFLFVGRMLADKGVLEFVEAARMVKEERKDVEFRLLGPIDTGNPSGLSKNQIDRFESEGIVRYLGSVDDVREQIADSDCLVLPTRYKEGMPRVLMEAAAMARPVLATNVRGCTDIVVEGETGFLVAPGNSIELGKAMKSFLSKTDSEKRKIGEQAAKIAAEKFDENLVAKKYFEVTNKVLGLSSSIH